MTKKNRIALLAVILLAALSTNASAVTILYTAEGDTTGATDSALADGAQNGTFNGTGVAVSTTNPGFGADAFDFTAPGGLNAINLNGTSGTGLGSAFTLAGFFATEQTARLRAFSSFLGTGGVGPDTLIFDFLAGAADGTGNGEVRAFVNGVNTTVTPLNFYKDDGDYTHLALTYDSGSINIFVDGANVGSASVGAAALNLTNNLQVGEDFAGTNVFEQLVGNADDILVRGRHPSVEHGPFSGSDLGYRHERGGPICCYP